MKKTNLPDLRNLPRSLKGVVLFALLVALPTACTEKEKPEPTQPTTQKHRVTILCDRRLTEFRDHSAIRDALSKDDVSGCDVKLANNKTLSTTPDEGLDKFIHLHDSAADYARSLGKDLQGIDTLYVPKGASPNVIQELIRRGYIPIELIR